MPESSEGTHLSKILLVDDDKRFAESVVTLFSQEHEVSTVHEPTEAMKILGQLRPDLVLLDFGLPQISGLEFLKLLKRRMPELPVVMLTGNSQPETIIETMKAGASDFVIKGSDEFAANLKFRVANVLEKAAILRRNRNLIQENETQFEKNRKLTANCLEVKDSTVKKLNEYASEKTNGVSDQISSAALYSGQLDSAYYKNYTASMALVNYYSDQHEGRMGIQKGALAPGTAGSIFQTMNRVFSWDGLLGIVGLRETQGAAEAAKRSQEFSEHLARAPHVAGFIRMLLVAIFPWLMFFVVAGHYRVLIVWFWIYFSVLLWTPLWTLLYHVMLGIAMSGEVMQSFGQMTDGVSLYAAALVNHRLYYMFSIYAWVQLLVATLTTGSAFMFLKPMLGESDTESKPEFLDSTLGPAQTAASGVAKAVL